MQRSTLLMLTVGGLAACYESTTPPRYAGTEVVLTPSPPPGAPATQQPAAQPPTAPEMRRFQLAYPTGDPETSMLVVEKLVPAEVRVGERYTYTIRVTNVSDETLVNVMVTDTARGLEIIRDQRQPAGRQAGQFMIEQIAPGQTETFEVSAVGRQVGTSASCLGVEYQPTLCSPVAVVDPELRIEKRAPATALACERPRFTYQVTNTGTGTARDVMIMEDLPAGLTTEEGAQQIRIPVGDLPAGQTVSRSVAVRAAEPGRFESRAIARSQTDEVTSQPAAIAISQPELEVDVTAPAWQYSGENVRYRVTVRNTSGVAARDARVNLQSSAPIPQPVRSLGNLAPGQSRTIDVTLVGQGERLQLDASAQAACAPLVADRGITEIRGVAALRVGTVDSVDPIRVGENVTYIVSVTNQGDDPAEGVVVSAIIPENLTIVDVDGRTEPVMQGNRLVLGTLKSLPPKQTARWDVTARADGPGVARFRTEVSGSFLAQPVPDVEPTRIIDPQ
jgi:uncharacterized repeat protein (TIGR01451 family)